MTTNRLFFAALVLAAASGCARERVAYEMHLSSAPVRRSYRAPRPASHDVVVRYTHDDHRHRCDATCEEYWPDVYRHGQAEHRCDGTCPSYAAPRPQRRTISNASLSVDHVQSFTSPSSSTTARFTTTYEAEPYDAAPTSSRVVVYAHGHARHRCAASCANYYAVPRRAVSVTVYGHGHRLHRCESSCGSYRAPGVQVVFGHGHASHRCWTGCSSYRAPGVQIVFGHGHASHRCWTGCSSYRAPGVQLVFGHGHASHHCHSGCSSWVDPDWSRRRGGVVVFGHGHAGHLCGSSCSSYYVSPRRHVSPGHRHLPVSPHLAPRHHHDGHGRRGGSIGVRIGVGARWGNRR